MNALFFEAQHSGPLNSNHFFSKHRSCSNSQGLHVDRVVFLHDQNCYWRSLNSGEMYVHRASFLTAHTVLGDTSGGR